MSRWYTGTVPWYSRTRVKVGARTGARTPSSSAAPWTNVVFPAPRPPVSETPSPGRRPPATAAPTARVCSGDAAVRSSPGAPTDGSEQPELLLGPRTHRDRLRHDLPDRLEVGAKGGHLRAGLATPVQHGRRMVRGEHRPPVHVEA